MILHRTEDFAQAVNLDPRRADLRTLYAVVDVWIGLQPVDQRNVGIDGIAKAFVAGIPDLAVIAGNGWRRNAERGCKSAQR